VFIPISPEYPGDSGYINLPSLAAGNQVWQYSTTFLIGLHGINSCGKVVKLTNEKDVSLVRFPLSNTGSRRDDYHLTSKKNSSQLPSENKASSNLGQNP
jgi:hypothetical protein